MAGQAEVLVEVAEDAVLGQMGVEGGEYFQIGGEQEGY